MPGENVYDWSVTAADNDHADSGINWAEHMPRADVNNSARSLMAAIAKWRDLNNGSIVTGGTANAQTFLSGLNYTVTPETGLTCKLKIGPALTNTLACTLNMDGLGDVAILNVDGAALTTGVLIAGRYYDFLWNGTNWIVLAAAVAATAADQAAGTSTSTVVTPATQGLHQSAAKAWAFAGTAGNLVDGYNVSSVTDAAVGQIVINFAVPFSAANYCVVGNGLVAPGSTPATTYITHIHGQTAGSVTMTLVHLSDFSVADPTNWHCAVFATI